MHDYRTCILVMGRGEGLCVLLCSLDISTTIRTLKVLDCIFYVAILNDCLKF